MAAFLLKWFYIIFRTVHQNKAVHYPNQAGLPVQ
jgi:hypothetical protein